MGEDFGFLLLKNEPAVKVSVNSNNSMTIKQIQNCQELIIFSVDETQQSKKPDPEEITVFCYWSCLKSMPNKINYFKIKRCNPGLMQNNTWDGTLSKSDTQGAQELMRLDALPQKFPPLQGLVAPEQRGAQEHQATTSSMNAPGPGSCCWASSIQINPTLTHPRNLGAKKQEPGHTPVLHWPVSSGSPA